MELGGEGIQKDFIFSWGKLFSRCSGQLLWPAGNKATMQQALPMYMLYQ
jgi:hypothetical protein